MAVIVLKHAEKYAGTHAERLAMDVSSVNKGATFFEWDTSELFTLSPTGWVEKIGQVKGEMSLSGSKAEQASAQDTQVATTAKTYTKAAGASQMEVYCETGYIRVRTDGEACTSTTGEPIAAGFGSGWQVDSISVYYIQESVITVVSR